jgi:hypothetical protein
MLVFSAVRCNSLRWATNILVCRPFVLYFVISLLFCASLYLKVDTPRTRPAGHKSITSPPLLFSEKPPTRRFFFRPAGFFSGRPRFFFRPAAFFFPAGHVFLSRPGAVFLMKAGIKKPRITHSWSESVRNAPHSFPCVPPGLSSVAPGRTALPDKQIRQLQCGDLSYTVHHVLPRHGCERYRRHGRGDASQNQY